MPAGAVSFLTQPPHQHLHPCENAGVSRLNMGSAGVMDTNRTPVMTESNRAGYGNAPSRNNHLESKTIDRSPNSAYGVARTFPWEKQAASKPSSSAPVNRSNGASANKSIAPKTVERGPNSSMGVARSFPWEKADARNNSSTNSNHGSYTSSSNSGVVPSHTPTYRETTNSTPAASSSNYSNKSQKSSGGKSARGFFSISATPKTVSGSSGNSAWVPRSNTTTSSSGSSYNSTPAQKTNVRSIRSQYNSNNRDVQQQKRLEQQRLNNGGYRAPTGHRALPPEERKQVNWARFR